MILAIIGEIADILLGYLSKDKNPPPIVSTLLSKIVPALSQAVGETAEQTAERRARVEEMFAKHANPIGPVPPA